MIRRWLASALALLLIPLGACGQGAEDRVMDRLRGVPGVRKVSTLPWAIRFPDHLFLVELDDNPTADTMTGVREAYAETVGELTQDDILIEIRWQSEGIPRLITGHGNVVPPAEFFRAAGAWPADLEMAANFYPASSSMAAPVSDDEFRRTLDWFAGLDLPASSLTVRSARYIVSWTETAPIALFDEVAPTVPTAEKITVHERVALTNSDGSLFTDPDSVTVTWPGSSPATEVELTRVRDEMNAVVDAWASWPTLLALRIKVGSDTQAYLTSEQCPTPESAPLTHELWAYAQRDGRRVVAASTPC